MDDIQSWSEVPSIAHFCSLFRAAFNLLDFDIEELEEALLTDGAEDCGSSLLQELIVRLLCGCVENSEISTFNYQMYLRRLFRQKCQEYGRENPFNTDIDFQFLPLRTKVEILHALCDFRLDAEDVQDLLKNLESDSLRVEPLGHDENKSAYWYFYGTRLYREDFPRNRKKIREKRRKSKEDKRKKKKNKIAYESDIEDEIAPGVWQVVCFTEEDWEKLASKFKGSTCKDERALHRTLKEDFLPEIPRLFAEKERLQRKRMMEYQPRRQSSRLEKLKQREEEEKVLAQEEEEKLRLERDERERRERLMARAVRAINRVPSRSGSECGSFRSEYDVNDLNNGEHDGEEQERIQDDDDEDSKYNIGRQTNNSLSSATGQIIIQPPRRKKLRSKLVYKASTEDLQTGMYKILDYIKNKEEAWPFIDPVDEDYAPRYYSVIRKPMDLQRMEDKLESGEYLTLHDFKSDFQLIVDNCRQYNGSENEYTIMVGALQVAFHQAIERYLESEVSSDEEVAVEFPPSIEGKKHRGRKKKRRRDKEQNKENKKMKYESGVESDSKPPSLKPQRLRSPMSDKSGSIPGSDFDAREPDFLRETSPPQLMKMTEMDTGDDSSQDSLFKKSVRSRHDVPVKSKTKKPPTSVKSVEAIEALALATEQTLKDINKWLDDTPRFSEFSSASNSPSHFIMAEEFEAVGNRIESEYRKSLKMDKPVKTKDGNKDTVSKRRRQVSDTVKPQKKREIQRTIDRLQPGKSKGNLITNLPKPKENIEETGIINGLGLGKYMKESRNALLVKPDETAPKLSLGTVLTSDIIDFGKSKHSFSEKEVEEVTQVNEKVTEQEPERVEGEEKPKEEEENEESTTTQVNTLPPKKSPEVRNEVQPEEKVLKPDKEVVEMKKEECKSKVGSEERKKISGKENTNKTNSPNFNAWFKAFGGPKSTPNTKKKTDNIADQSRAPLSPNHDNSRSESAFKCVSERIPNEVKSWFGDSLKNSPVDTPPSVDSDEAKSLTVASPMPSPDISQVTNQPAPRQRKASTSSSMSERSSFSQDQMDGSSPHLSVDERLGPYPSPLHRSPVASSPVLASPKGDDLSKNTYQAVNGTLRVGFYQDTSSNLQKSSPEKQSPRNSSPFQSYSHIYPPTSSSAMFGQAPPTPSSYYDNYSVPLNYYDQGKSVISEKQEDAYNYTTRQSAYPSSGGGEVVPAKLPSSVFPVKKRLYTAELQQQQQQQQRAPPTYPDPGESYSRLLHQQQQQQQQYERYHPADVRYPVMTSEQLELPRMLQHSEPINQDLSRVRYTLEQEKQLQHQQNSQQHQPNVQQQQQQQSSGDANSLSLLHSELARLQHLEPTNFSRQQQLQQNHQQQQQQRTLNRLQQHEMDEDNDGVFRSRYTDNNNAYLQTPHYFSDKTECSGYQVKAKTKKRSKNTEVTGFQQYVNLKPTAGADLKTSVPGSAFNFGPAPTGLDAYGGYLDDLRQQPSSYYSMVAAAAHHRSASEPGLDKTVHTSQNTTSPSFQFLGHPQARAASYPSPLTQFMNPHQAAGLMDSATAASYQQYLQRLQEEQLRLLGPPGSYPPGYHPALGIRRPPPFERPTWL